VTTIPCDWIGVRKRIVRPYAPELRDRENGLSAGLATVFFCAFILNTQTAADIMRH
jgi:hypothetical protein